ncbi:MAG TPA: Ku protein [Actinomycetota bacterium]|nr:Ku protein [Actinomycetota bacterium]
MPTAVWTGAISFGLVTIPVRLFPATSPKDPRFRQIDRQTGRRVRHRRVVEEEVPAPTEAPPEIEESTEAPERPGAERAEVPYEDIVKGYEIEKGRHVILEPEEVEDLRAEKSETIDIEHFVPLDAIDPVYFEKSYHVAPRDEAATKPYTLLREAMDRAGRVAIGRFVLRTREHLAAIRPAGGILALETLFYADEVRTPAWSPLPAPAAKGSKAEMAMAKQLIDMMAADWEPELYRDTYRERVLDLVSKREPTATEEAPSRPQVPDLMAALKASVEAQEKSKGARTGRRSRKAGGGRAR